MGECKGRSFACASRGEHILFPHKKIYRYPLKKVGLSPFFENIDKLCILCHAEIVIKIMRRFLTMDLNSIKEAVEAIEGGIADKLKNLFK